MYSLTVFKNQYDNKTDKRIDFQTWPEFVELLPKGYQLSLTIINDEGSGVYLIKPVGLNLSEDGTDG